jgi:hypothetical protein
MRGYDDGSNYADDDHSDAPGTNTSFTEINPHTLLYPYSNLLILVQYAQCPCNLLKEEVVSYNII